MFLHTRIRAISMHLRLCAQHRVEQDGEVVSRVQNHIKGQIVKHDREVISGTIKKQNT